MSVTDSAPKKKQGNQDPAIITSSEQDKASNTKQLTDPAILSSSTFNQGVSLNDPAILSVKDPKIPETKAPEVHATDVSQLEKSSAKEENKSPEA